MAPTRGLLICPATIGRYSLSPDTPVWILASHEDSWEVEYRDASGRVARSCIQRCRAHGTLFLRDTRGTVAWYERVTLLGPDDGGSWLELWKRHHGMSDDWLNLKGRTW